MNIKKLKVVEGGISEAFPSALLTEDSRLTRGNYRVEVDKLILCMLPEQLHVGDIIRIEARLAGTFRIKSNDNQVMLFGRLSPCKSIRSRGPYDYIELMAVNEERFVVTHATGRFIIRSGRPKKQFNNE